MRQTNPLFASAHFHSLWVLEHQTLTLSELAELQSVSLPTMSNTVTILEERGWVKRVRSKADRRKVTVEITPAGLAMLEQTRQHMKAHVSQIISAISGEDRAAVSQGLEILREVFLKASAFDNECQHEEGKE